MVACYSSAQVPESPVQTPDSPTPPEITDRPFFSRGGHGRAAVSSMLMFTDLAVIAVAAVVLLVITFGFVQSYSPIVPPPIPWAISTLLIGAITWNRLSSFIRSYRRGNSESSLPFEPDDRYRVQVHCWADQVSQLETITADAFEPEQFRALLPNDRWLDITRPINWTWPWGLVWGYFQFLSITKSEIVAAIGITLGTILVLGLFRLPTFVRLSPGRLEILRYPLFHLREPRRQVFSLRGRVAVSTKGAGFVQWTDDRGNRRVLPFMFVLDRAHARRAALAAALSSADVPALDE